MGLQKQIVPINFGKGIDDKADPQLMIPGSMLLLTDCQFGPRTGFSKRDGFAPLGVSTFSGTSISSGFQLSRRKGELLLYGAESGIPGAIYSRSPTASKWSNRGNMRQFTANVASVKRSTDSQSQFDCAYYGGYSIWAWKNVGSSTSIEYAVFDESTNTQIAGGTILSNVATACIPRIVKCSDRWGIIYGETTTNALYYRYVLFATPSTISAPSTISVSLFSAHMDAAYQTFSAGSDLILVSFRSSATQNRIIRFDGTGAVLTTVNWNPTGTTRCLSLDVFADLAFSVNYDDATDGKVARVYAGDLSLVGSVVLNSSTTQVNNMGAVVTSGGVIEVYWDENAASSRNDIVRRKTLTSSATVSGGFDVAMSVSLASKPWAVGTDLYVALVHNSAEQQTTFVARADSSTSPPMIVARLSTWSAAGKLSANRLTNVPSVGSSKYLLPIGQRGRVTTDGGTFVAPNGISKAILDFGRNEAVTWNEQADSTFYACAAPWQYDGSVAVEAGFHLYPENVSLSDVGAGSLSAGSYSYRVTYEWTDANGQVHQSIPSTPISISLAAGRQIMVTIPTLRLTTKRNVALVVWRTEANGSVYYRLNGVSSPTYNTTSSDTVSYADNMADASIVTNQVLYTTGGVLECEPMPCCRLIESHQNRLFVAGLEDPYEIRWSREIIEGEGPAFHETFSRRIPETHGVISALKSIDNQLIIFAERGIFVLTGEGPSDTGSQDGYSEPQLIIPDTGCIRQSPWLVSVRDGTFFPSSRGYQLLNRSLQIDESIGVPFDNRYFTNINSGSYPKAAILVPKISAVLLGFNVVTNPIIGYDYRYGGWFHWTNHQMVDMVAWDNAIIHLKSNGESFKSGSVTDNGIGINMSLTSGWISLAGIQGAQRVYRLLFLGSGRPSSGTMELRIRHNYDTSVTAGPYSLTNSSVTSGPMQFRHHLAKQKCQAIQFVLNESGVTDVSLTLTNFALEVGIKPGSAKLGPERTI